MPAVSLRLATLADVPTLVQLGRAMHAESPRYGHWPFDEEKVTCVLQALIPMPAWAGVLAIDNVHGEVVGTMVGLVQPHIFCQALVAADLALYVRPAWRSRGVANALIEAYERRAIELGAQEITTGVSSGRTVKAVQRLFERRGYTVIGPHMVKYV